MNRIYAREKAEALVAQMTLDEKVTQLRHDAPAIKRLGIPKYNWWGEGLHGVARAGTATVFPQAIGMAATFDEKMIERIAEIVAVEGRAKYNAYSSHEDRGTYKGLTFWAPNINIFRDPRWGRGQETYGEDPFLTSRLGVAYVKGLQGDGETMKAAACAKHFVAHSGPEAIRHEFNALVSPKDMEETYLPAFESLVKEAKVEAVMGAYNRTNGEPCCGSKKLIKELLREQWGFQGHFVSDCWAIKDFHENHGVTVAADESAAMAINAGCDLNCGNTYLHILNAYYKGYVTEETITESVVRLFTTRYLLGIMEESEYDTIPYDKIECKDHLKSCEEAALKSMVMLKNSGVLPINLSDVKTLGVIGPNADSIRALQGNYYGTSSNYVTVLRGIKEYVGDKARVLYAKGCALGEENEVIRSRKRNEITEAVIVAEQSDIVVLCLGLDETLEGEQGDTGNDDASGDKKDLSFPELQQELMEAVIACGKPVILCLMAGGDMDLSVPKEKCAGILNLWYPGALGGKAAAKILFGEVSPSGKLPITFYENVDDLLDIEDYSMKGRTYRYLESRAQYPFGYGLTYGDVHVQDAKVVEKNGQIMIEAHISNRGTVETEDVIQLYIQCLDSEFAPPNASLCAFSRVCLKSMEEKTITLTVPDKSFTVVDHQGIRSVGGHKFKIYVGTNQPEKVSIELTKKEPICLEVNI